MRRKRWLSSSVAVLLVAGATIAVTARDAGKGSEGAPLRSVVLDAVRRDAVFAALARQSAQAQNKTIALTLPHHLLADDVIAKAVQSVANEPDSAAPQAPPFRAGMKANEVFVRSVAAQPLAANAFKLRPSSRRGIDTIVIVGPDHQSLGSTYFTTTKKSFAWEDTTLTTNTKLESALLASPEFAESDAVVADEHSVLIPAVFFHARFPEAKFVFVTVRFGMHEDALEALAQTLAKQGSGRILLAVSIDFSHYKSFDEAEREDAETLRRIENGDKNAFTDAAMDSPAALWLAFRYAELQGASVPTVVDHKNSAELTGDRTQAETTSYFVLAFRKDE